MSISLSDNVVSENENSNISNLNTDTHFQNYLSSTSNSKENNFQSLNLKGVNIFLNREKKTFKKTFSSNLNNTSISTFSSNNNENLSSSSLSDDFDLRVDMCINEIQNTPIYESRSSEREYFSK